MNHVIKNKMSIKINTEVERFLYESNLIEREPSERAFIDAKIAWQYTRANKKLDVSNILEINGLLMKGLNPRIAGKFRNCDVWIGGNRKTFVSYRLFIEQLNEVLRQLNKFKKNNECDARRLHIDFENVHPFEDGNGRVGRIIYNFYRLKSGLPLDIIYDAEKGEYYKWFKD